MESLRVFISHSHEDEAFCRTLIGALQAASIDVWYDQESSDSGQLLDIIERELRHRPIFVLVLSPAALRSSWVLDECRWAYTLYRADPTRLILPVLGSGGMVEDQLPLYLRGFRRIEASGMRPYSPEEAARRTVQALGTSPDLSQSEPATEHGDTIAELLAYGKTLYARQQFTDAKAVFESIVERDPKNIDGWLNLGYVNNQLKRHTETQSAFDRATALDSKSVPAWIGKGKALCELGRLKEALSACDRALSIDRSSAVGWATKAYVLNRLSRYKDALGACDKSIALDPYNVFAWENKAFALRARGDQVGAAAADQRARDLR
jgi:tetratricopeptide (TPR) repeat protein